MSPPLRTLLTVLRDEQRLLGEEVTAQAPELVLLELDRLALVVDAELGLAGEGVREDQVAADRVPRQDDRVAIDAGVGGADAALVAAGRVGGAGQAVPELDLDVRGAVVGVAGGLAGGEADVMAGGHVRVSSLVGLKGVGTEVPRKNRQKSMISSRYSWQS